MRDCENVRRAGAARYSRGAVRTDRHAPHSAQVEDDAVAQGAASPVVASATHRYGKGTIAGGTNRQGHVFCCLAMDDGTR
jgi:hypothetical protein